jgi:hypothetical protein
MPELQHYATPEEAIAILRDVVEQHGLSLIPEEPVLVQPYLDTYDHLTPEVKRKVQQFPVVQLEGPFTKYPLQFSRRETGRAAGTYFVELMSGPRLRWVLPGLVEERDRSVVTPGTISYLDSYRNLHTNEWEAASEELKQDFQAVVKTLKGHMLRVPVRKGEKIWVARGTQKKLEARSLFIDR